MKLKCIQSSLDSDGKEYNIREVIQEVTTEVGFDGELWARLTPGVTGYESASLKDLFRSRKFLNGVPLHTWPACAGTPNSWDRLIVPANELERLLDMLSLFPVNAQWKGKLNT